MPQLIDLEELGAIGSQMSRDELDILAFSNRINFILDTGSVAC